jgi:hypothetical protein
VNVNISNYAPASQAQVWQLTGANVITRLSDISVSSTFNVNVPAQSITLLVIGQGASSPTPTPTPTPSPTPTPTFPVIFTEETSQRLIALESVNLLRDPFIGNTTQNFSTDQRARIMLLAGNIDLSAGESLSSVTAEADDGSGGIYPLTIESVTRVPGHAWLSQVIIRFPDQWMSPKNVWVTLKLRGIASNKAFVSVKP